MKNNTPDLWLHDMLLQAFLKNGFSLANGNKSWELTDLQFLFLTPDLAKGFLKLTEDPAYRTQFFELEVQMIKQQARSLVETIGNEPFNLIDIWCGDGFKAVELIKTIGTLSPHVQIRYCPLNASQYLIDTAIDNVKKAKLTNIVGYQPFLSSGDGRSLRDIGKHLRTKEFPKHVIMLLGGVLACYEINSYLFELNRDLLRDDVVLIGNGVRVGERLVNIEKYKGNLFHQWLKNLIIGLGFKESEVEFDARFGNSRIELFYRLLVEKTKIVDKRVIKFARGDELVLGALYKYYAHEFDMFCRMYFADSHVTLDNDKGYALVVCKK